jgi:hypothetical protein
MGFNAYKKIQLPEIADKTKLLEDYNGKFVAIKDSKKCSFYEGTLNFNRKDLGFYYIEEESITRRFNLSNLEQFFLIYK